MGLIITMEYTEIKGGYIYKTLQINKGILRCLTLKFVPWIWRKWRELLFIREVRGVLWILRGRRFWFLSMGIWWTLVSKRMFRGRFIGQGFWKLMRMFGRGWWVFRFWRGFYWFFLCCFGEFVIFFGCLWGRFDNYLW